MLKENREEDGSRHCWWTLPIALSHNALRSAAAVFYRLNFTDRKLVSTDNTTIKCKDINLV